MNYTLENLSPNIFVWCASIREDGFFDLDWYAIVFIDSECFYAKAISAKKRSEKHYRFNAEDVIAARVKFDPEMDRTKQIKSYPLFSPEEKAGVYGSLTAIQDSVSSALNSLENEICIDSLFEPDLNPYTQSYKDTLIEFRKNQHLNELMYSYVEFIFRGNDEKIINVICDTRAVTKLFLEVTECLD